MKKFIRALFIVFCTIALGVLIYYFIQARSSAAEANKPLAAKKLVLANSDPADAAAAKAELAASLNKISALPNEVILDVQSLNLDQDEGDEQILTVRKTDKAGDRLSIVVADFLPQRRGWVRAWEGETLSTKLTTFQIQASDLVGDHGLDIICTGMNEENDQTMTVFHHVPGPQAETLCYSQALAIAADSVEIDKVDRSEGYQLGQTRGASFPINAYRHDSGSENLLDQIKTVYNWDSRSGSYVAGATEKVAGAQVEQEMAAKVLTGNEKDFESFLRGTWCASGKGPFDPDARLLVFDKEGKSIIFYSPENQEDFDWNESHSTRYGLYVGCQNESVSDLRRLMDIELTGADTISVRVIEDIQLKVDAQDGWSGSYTRVPVSAVSAALATTRSGQEIRLQGSYRGQGGNAISFEGQRFTLKLGGEEKKGGFVVYKLGDENVIQLSPLLDSGIVAERETFRLRFSETRSGKATLRHIELSPARATIDGLELLEEPELEFDQRIGG
jgi:hypothetical protein